MNAISITTLLLSFFLAWLLIPVVIRFSFKKGFFDEPNERKVHSTNIPRLGGTSFLPVCLCAFLFAVLLGHILGVERLINDFSSHSKYYLYGLIGSMLLYAVGIFDDVWGVRYRNKFLAQFLAGLLLCVSGLWLDNLYGLFGLNVLPYWIGWPITIFAIIFVTNAINFIDGIDGLASSICAVALMYYCVLFYMFSRGAHDYLIITLATLGPVFAFTWFNLFGSEEKKTKTFMGDTGSLFLGFILCVFGIIICRLYKYTENYNPFVLGFAPMILPCFDVIRVVLMRIKRHANPFLADKSHIHHKFLAFGFSQHQVLVIVVIISMFFSSLTILLSIILPVNWVLLIILVLWAVFNLAIKKKEKI